MIDNEQIALALGISYDGQLMGQLECFTDRRDTGGTLAVPIGADLATVRARLVAMRSTFDRANSQSK